MSKKPLRALALALGLFAIAACAPRAENEAQYWENHNKAVAEYSTKWPGFGAPLSAQQAKAKPVWDEAAKLGDAKAKAEKMKQANEILGKLVGKLDEVKEKSKGVEGTAKKMAELKLTKDKDGDRSKAIEAAHKLVGEVDAAMAAAKPSTEEEAIKVADEQISRLISGAGDADRALAALKPKDAKDTKAASSKKK